MQENNWLEYATKSSEVRMAIDIEKLELEEQEIIREVYQKMLRLQDLAYVKALVLNDYFYEELKKQNALGANKPSAERNKHRSWIRSFVRLRDTHSIQMLLSRVVFKKNAGFGKNNVTLFQLQMNKNEAKYSRHQFRKCELWLRYLLADLDDQYCVLRQRQADLNKIRTLLQQYSQKTFELHKLTRSLDSPFGIGYKDAQKNAEKSALVLTANRCHQMIKAHQMEALGPVEFKKLVKASQKIVDQEGEESESEDDV